jgi:two-component system, NtrC family, response regulator AtoC
MGRKRAAAAEPGETRSQIALALEDGPAALCLLVSSASGVAVVPLAGESSLLLGRSDDCDVVIEDDSVSRRHARLTLGEAPTLEDLASRNGTRVDGRRLSAGAVEPLRVGTAFEIGAVTVFLYRAQSLLPADRPSTAPSPTPRRPAQAASVVAVDAAMKRVFDLVEVVAPSPLSILVVGETGVGKEVVAAAVHANSNRSHEPFLQINCAALPESILEGELFGYEKGAFTGAVTSKAGLFESAHGGTVFLDEVGEIPPGVQAKLLRVLESGEVMRLGSLRPLRVDIRVVAATNRDLRAAMAAGSFRSDLYFRLNGMTIVVPPLRDRKADVLPLAHLFLARAAERLGRPAPALSEAAAQTILASPWPGNVRELRNTMERAVVLCGALDIAPAHLVMHDDGPSAAPAAPSPPTARPPASSIAPAAAASGSLTTRVEELEMASIVEALEATAGNQSRAAKRLGITRRVLVKRIERYGILRPRKGRKDDDG